MAGVEVRVLTEEAHNISAQATQYGVESGKSISDHVILQPNQVDVSFEMTNTDGGAEKARAVFHEFVRLRDERMPLTLDTEHARYKNMVITRFTPDHSAPHKGAFRATVTLQQVGVVGEDSMIAATGGRPASVLAKDGTQKTAVAYRYTGASDTATNRALSERITAALASYSNTTEAAA